MPLRRMATLGARRLLHTGHGEHGLAGRPEQTCDSRQATRVTPTCVRQKNPPRFPRAAFHRPPEADFSSRSLGLQRAQRVKRPCSKSWPDPQCNRLPRLRGHADTQCAQARGHAAA